MVIDKTTGKGCAWSIVSKSITKRLIAENIIGKTIYRKPRKSGYKFFQVIALGDNPHVWPKRSDELSVEPLWTPSFIDAGIWKQAVSNFKTCERLDRNVEYYLLPKMEEYLLNISDVELVSLTRDFLIEYGVIYSPISQRAGNTYYFNEKEIYSLDKKSELFPYEKQPKFNIFNAQYETCFNTQVWRKAISQFEVGMTLTECISIFLQTELVHRASQEVFPVDRLVQSITSPIYERVPGNTNKATFDRIRIAVGVPRYQFDSWDDLRNEINRYQPEIYQRVVEKLEKNRQFKKYGVPISFLKLSDVTLRRDCSIEFIFELKEGKHQTST